MCLFQLNLETKLTCDKIICKQLMFQNEIKCIFQFFIDRLLEVTSTQLLVFFYLEKSIRYYHHIKINGLLTKST